MESACYNLDMDNNRSYDMYEMGYGPAIKYRRQKLGRGQAWLAEMMGVDQTTVSKWEQRHDPPKDETFLEDLALHLKGTVEELRAGTVPRGFPNHDRGNLVILRESPEEFAASQDVEAIQIDLLAIKRLSPNELKRVKRLVKAFKEDIEEELRSAEKG
ncbi:MAG TPA: helix-turn-helix domain-containing protein [Chloroflexia bacterium]|jgi:transcriptional regulator with XRE-family HTH domain